MVVFIEDKIMDAKGVQKRLSDNIRRLRKEKGLTQFALAEKAEISEATIKSVELCLNWPSEKTLAQIANALETDISKLFFPIADSVEFFNENQKQLKEIISENLKLYINTAIKEIIS